MAGNTDANTVNTPEAVKARVRDIMNRTLSDSALEDARNALTKKPTKSLKFTDVNVERQGNSITIPEGMSYADGQKWLKLQEEAEERKVAIGHQLECFPLDGARALTLALEAACGFIDLRATPGFFGDRPPRLHTIRTGLDTVETVVLGRIAPMGMEGGYLEAYIPGDTPRMYITGEVKAKFKPAVNAIIRLTEAILREASVYRGNALTLDLSWLQRGEFDPDSDSPEFMDVRNVSEDQLILADTVRYDLKSNIWALIEQTDACRKLGIPLRHGAILAGPYGTGKTLAARVTAAKAVENSWTFFYLKQPQHLAHALRLAELYAPAVLFVEDVDKVATGQRTTAVDDLLNTMDGVDTKGKAIVTIMSTNHVETINPAMMRAGRVDTLVTMGHPDAKAAWEFVRLYGRDAQGVNLIADDTDSVAVGEALAGLAPAFISEAVQKAKRYVMAIHGTADLAGLVDTAALVGAADSVRSHSERSALQEVDTPAEQVVKAAKVVGQALGV